MKSNLLIKSLAVVALVGAAVASQADSFSVEESGTYVNVTPLTVSSTFSTVMQLVPTSLPENVTGGAFLLTESAAPNPGGVSATGSLTVYGTTPADSLTFNFVGTVYSGATDSLSASATLVSASGTGAYSMYTSGIGNLAFQLISVTGTTGLSVGTISGNVQAVPEPVSMAVLGLGVAGLLVRRRKS